MKKPLNLKRKAFIFFLLVLVFCGNSCRRDNMEPTPVNYVGASLQTLPESAKVHTDEINNWFAAYPQIKPSPQLLSMAQQAVINGKHVVKIPIATDAALYFTRYNGALKAFAYKWEAGKLNTKEYVGKIFTLSFESGTAKMLNYSFGKLTIDNVKVVPLGQQLPGGDSSITPVLKEMDIKTLLQQVICRLTGGDWHDGVTSWAKGELQAQGCDYSVEDSQGGSDGSSSSGYSGIVDGINYGSPNINGIISGTVYYGDGAIWVMTPTTVLAGCQCPEEYTRLTAQITAIHSMEKRMIRI